MSAAMLKWSSISNRLDCICANLAIQWSVGRQIDTGAQSNWYESINQALTALIALTLRNHQG